MSHPARLARTLIRLDLRRGDSSPPKLESLRLQNGPSCLGGGRQQLSGVGILVVKRDGTEMRTRAKVNNATERGSGGRVLESVRQGRAPPALQAIGA